MDRIWFGCHSAPETHPLDATLSQKRPFSIVRNEAQERNETELNREELAGAGQPTRMYLKYRLAEEPSQRASLVSLPTHILNSGYFQVCKIGFGIPGDHSSMASSQNCANSAYFAILLVWHTNCSISVCAIKLGRAKDDLVVTPAYVPIEGAAGRKGLPILRYRSSGGRDWPLVVGSMSSRGKIGRSAVWSLEHSRRTSRSGLFS